MVAVLVFKLEQLYRYSQVVNVDEQTCALACRQMCPVKRAVLSFLKRPVTFKLQQSVYAI